MVNPTTPSHLDKTFSALSDPTRRQMISMLSQKHTLTVTQLADPFDISLPAASKHIKVLETAKLIKRHRRGRVHHLRLNQRPLIQATQWIKHHKKYWKTQLDNLEKYINNSK